MSPYAVVLLCFRKLLLGFNAQLLKYKNVKSLHLFICVFVCLFIYLICYRICIAELIYIKIIYFM